MDTLIHADIFFFITTIAVIVITVVFLVIAFYLIGFLSRARDIADEIKAEAKLVREDVNEARMRVKAGGLRLAHLLDFFSGWGGGKKIRQKSRSKNKT